jgi:hypothetical protein
LLSLLAAYVITTLWLSVLSFDHYIVLLAAYFRIATSLWIFVALVALAVLRYRTKPAADGAVVSLLQLIGQEFERRWQRDRFLSLLTPPLIFALLLASFNVFKQHVLPRAGFPFDPALAALDRMLFGGIDPWRLTHAMLPSPWATLAIDSLYHGWFLPMSLGVMICSFLPAAADEVRIRYLVSFVGVWVLLGSGLAALLPAAGPCFQPTAIGLAPGFEPLVARLGAQQAWITSQFPAAVLSAVEFQRVLLDMHSADDGLALGGGIAAMPSIHNALAGLFAIAAFRIDRRLGWVMTAYAVLIWVGSVHLGWHYAIDGPAAVAATAVIWWASGSVARVVLAGRG